MKESYSKKYKNWDEEITESVPRQVRLKFGVLLLLIPLLLLVWILFTATAYFILTAIIQNKNLNPEVLALVPLFITVGIFFWVGDSEKKAIRQWEKVIGKVDYVKHGYRGGLIFGIGYEYGHQYFLKDNTDGRGMQDAESGDPVILVVNPKNPDSYVSYGDSSWKALKKKKF